MIGASNGKLPWIATCLLFDIDLVVLYWLFCYEASPNIENASMV